jgi:hypothetical protein
MRAENGVSTPDATVAQSQSRTASAINQLPDGRAPTGSAGRGENVDFTISPRLPLAARSDTYERKSSDPVYRPLRIFAVDPSLSRLEGAEANLNVPYEELQPGPVGAVLEVDDRDDTLNIHWGKVDLDRSDILIANGLRPSVSDPASHQQMIYAVATSVYAAFRRALGRNLNWAFHPEGASPRCRLVLRPHAAETGNAYYDRDNGEICFGYCRAAPHTDTRVLPHGFVFTCLSHDVVAHEMTHAILDGLRSHFIVPTGRDVLAFHEGFADMVALFQRFSYAEVVRAAIRKSRGNLNQAELLTNIAAEFGRAVGQGHALRTAIDEPGAAAPPKRYPARESHECGEILVRSIFEAYVTVFTRKTERYRRLAEWSGSHPAEDLPESLQEILADRASKLASQFLSICIRAIDYCPPVDLELGEYLRALITADFELVPDDPWAYREALIDAFARRGIYPPNVSTLAEDSLRWQSVGETVPEIPQLHFAELKFAGDPAQPASSDELRRQARALGSLFADPSLLPEFGLAAAGDPALHGDEIDLPCIQSIRTCRRIGPDGQVIFDLVAEITQRRRVKEGRNSFDFYGGATVIVDPRGRVRYVIAKNILNDRRVDRQREFVSGKGCAFWEGSPEGARPRRNVFGMLCASSAEHREKEWNAASKDAPR